MDLPELNDRILQLVKHETDGNISLFAKKINIAQQRVDRLFRFDNRAQQFPTVPTDIIVNITKIFDEISPEWILLGKDPMIKTKSKENVIVYDDDRRTKSTKKVIIENDNKNDNILKKNEKYKKRYHLEAEYADQQNNENVNDFRLRTDRNVEKQNIPLYNIEATLGLVSLFTETHNYIPIDFINIPNLPRCDGAIYVTGDSMYPLLKSGDIVLYKQIIDIKNDIFWGEMYLISIEVDGDEYIAVKYIHKSNKEGYIKLASHNPDHAEKEIPFTKVRALAFIKASIRINSMK